MCGRYALSLGANAVRMHVEEELQRPVAAWEDEEDYNPARGYNIAPRTRNPIVLRGGGPSHGHDNADDDADKQDKKETKNDDKVLRIENMQWGLVPHWMKRAPDSGSMLKTINAREDTIIEGGSMWKSIRGRKRCIVVAEGFYEWLHKGTERIPHFIKRKDGKLMCLAGLWDSVTYEGEKKPLHTYTIVTTDCNKQMSFLHNRMPVILSDPDSIAAWLDTSDGQWSPELAKLLKPFEGELEIYPVPREVGKVGTQSSDYLKPVSERKGNIASFFAKQPVKKEESKASTSSPQAKEERKEKKSKSITPEETKESESFAAEVKEEKDGLPHTDEPVSETKGKAETAKATSSDPVKPRSPAGKETVENESTDLPLNPDEGDEIASAEKEQDISPPPPSKQKAKGKASKPASASKQGKQKAIVLEDEDLDGAGETKKEAIALSDLDSASDASASKPSARTGSKKRKSKTDDKVESTNSAGGNKTKRQKGNPAHSKASVKKDQTPKSKSPSRSTRSTRASNKSKQKTATDDEGNKTLENFFEIEDD